MYSLLLSRAFSMPSVSQAMACYTKQHDVNTGGLAGPQKRVWPTSAKTTREPSAR